MLLSGSLTRNAGFTPSARWPPELAGCETPPWPRPLLLCENKVMTRRTTLAVLLLPALLVLAGCGSQPPAKRYPFQGNIQAVDPSAKIATIAAGPIGDWMGPMTMEYRVRPDSEFQKLHVGDRIQATMVVVTDTNYYVTDVKVLPKQ
jgi:Cu/Ag efflux protein CusF